MRLRGPRFCRRPGTLPSFWGFLSSLWLVSCLCLNTSFGGGCCLYFWLSGRLLRDGWEKDRALAGEAEGQGQSC